MITTEWCAFEELTLFTTTKVSSSKMHCVKLWPYYRCQHFMNVFFYESKLSSFSLITFGFVIFGAKILNEKCARKSLMKLTPWHQKRCVNLMWQLASWFYKEYNNYDNDEGNLSLTNQKISLLRFTFFGNSRYIWQFKNVMDTICDKKS